jgi:hypothetical protein
VTNRTLIRRIVFVFVFLLIVAAVFFLPVKIDYSVSSYAKLMPSQQWVILRGPDGMYMSTLKNVSDGLNSSYLVNQFERGASAEVKFNNNIRPNQYVQAGDTLGTIYSSTNFQRYIELQGLLNVARAELDVNLSGEKESVIQQAHQNFQLAESEADKQMKVTERLRQLNDKKIVSEEEYQLAADQLRSLKIAVEMRRAELETVKTGAKTSEINRIKSNIRAIENQIDAIKTQMNSFSIVAPFAGRIERSISNDTLLVLSETTSYLAFIPVALDEKEYLIPDTRIYLSIGSNTVSASALDINHTIEIVNNKQCVTLTAVFDGVDDINYGMIVPAELKGRSLSLLEFIISFLKSE